MTIHILKTENPHFLDIYQGRKRFELRFNDRNFKIGDFLILREYSKHFGGYSSSWHAVKVIHMMEGPTLGLAEGWVILSIARIRNYNETKFVRQHYFDHLKLEKEENESSNLRR